MRSVRGFTLLEVLVSVAILGIGLTAILSAQAGAFSSSAHARNISVASGLIRCKMSELEEHLLRDGFQELEETDSGVCCEGDETPNMRCAWKIEKPELPEPKYGELDLDTDIGSSDLGPLGALTDMGQSGETLAPDAGVAGIASALLSGGEPASEGEGPTAGGIAQMAMSFVYPDLKTLFEASTRRVTVTLTWTEGAREHSIELVQWLTNPQQGGLVGELPEGEEPPDGGKR